MWQSKLVLLKELYDIMRILNLKSIFRGEKNKDNVLIENSIRSIEDQLKLIEEKERTLKKVKGKVVEILQKLKTMNN
ncbi:hypothetical protein [Clostridium hydrogenum]|uniref:hypothetical protein n=1 Tax=Clostridium hydrogenum TaxID=2855764 RepID=UPI001F1847DA|nr:hypothetical protein [Clostridium hydrogenum]